MENKKADPSIKPEPFPLEHLQMRNTWNPELQADIRNFLDLTITEGRIPSQFAFFLSDNNNCVRLKPGLLTQFHCQTDNKGICMVGILGQCMRSPRKRIDNNSRCRP